MLVDFAPQFTPAWVLKPSMDDVMAANKNITHGMAGSPLYRVWRSMIERCDNPKNIAYKDYGGRGITVCWAWRLSFEAFYEDMGPRPPKHEIERINNNGNYEPSNCCWATRWEQVKNKRNTRLLIANGRAMHMAEWARELGVNPSAIHYRLRKGWSMQRAVTELAPKRPNSKLTDDQVREIRATYRFRSHPSVSDLATKYGVCTDTIHKVIHRRIFRDVQPLGAA